MNLKNRLPWLAAAAALAIVLYYLVAPGDQIPNRTAPRSVNMQSQSVAGATPSVRQREQVSGGPNATPGAGSKMPTPSDSPAALPRPKGPVSVSGTISDLQGSPVFRATIQVVYNLNGSQAKTNVLSDAKGHFSISGIPAQQLELLTVEAPGFGRSIVSDKEQLLLPIENLEISLTRLSGAALKILTTLPGSSVPQPFNGEATIYLMLRQDSRQSSQSAQMVEPNAAPGGYQTIANENVSVENGSYALKDVPPGVYKAAVVANDEYAESEPFRAGLGAGSEAVIVLGSRRKFSGELQSQSKKQPIPGADAVMYLSSRPLVSGRSKEYRVKTGPDGKFAFDSLVPGGYTLTLEAAGFTSKSVEKIDIPMGGAVPAAQVYYLVEGLPSVSVLVKDADGKPVPSSSLVLFGSSGDQPRSFFGKTDAAGFHRFDAIPAGRYTLAVTAPDSKSRQKSSDIVVAEGENKEAQIVFGHLVKVAGMAFAKGKPADGLLAFSERGEIGLPIYTKATENGAYTVDIEPGQYMVTQQSQPGRALVKVPDAESANIDFDLK